jgi:hypothetical protein
MTAEDKVLEERDYWGTPLVSIRYMAFHDRLGTRPWPKSRVRRFWMRLRGWTFVEDNMIELQQKINQAKYLTMMYGERDDR